MPDPIDLTGQYPVLPQEKKVAPQAKTIKKKEFYTPEEKSEPEKFIPITTAPEQTVEEPPKPIGELIQIYNPKDLDNTWEVDNSGRYFKNGQPTNQYNSIVSDRYLKNQIKSQIPEIQVDDIDLDDKEHLKSIVNKIKSGMPEEDLFSKTERQSSIDNNLNFLVKGTTSLYGRNPKDFTTNLEKFVSTDIPKITENQKLLEESNKIKTERDGLIGDILSGIVTGDLTKVGYSYDRYNELDNKYSKLESDLYYLNGGKKLRDAGILDYGKDIYQGIGNVLTNMVRSIGGAQDVYNKTNKDIFTMNFDNIAIGLEDLLNLNADPDVRQTWSRSVYQGLGSTLGFMLSGMLMQGVGIPSWLGTAISGALSESGNLMSEAKLKGKTLKQAQIESGLGLLWGSTEAIPISTALNLFGKGVTKPLGKFIKNLFLEGTEESIQEMFQQFSENVTEHYVSNPNNNIYEGLFQSGTSAFASALLFAGLIQGGSKLKNSIAKTIANKKGIDIPSNIYKMTNEEIDKFAKDLGIYEDMIKDVETFGNPVKEVTEKITNESSPLPDKLGTISDIVTRLGKKESINELVDTPVEELYSSENKDNKGLLESDIYKLQQYIHTNYNIGRKIQFIDSNNERNEGRINNIVQDNNTGKYIGFEVNNKFVSFENVVDDITINMVDLWKENGKYYVSKGNVNRLPSGENTIQFESYKDALDYYNKIKFDNLDNPNYYGRESRHYKGAVEDFTIGDSTYIKFNDDTYAVESNEGFKWISKKEYNNNRLNIVIPSQPTQPQVQDKLNIKWERYSNNRPTHYEVSSKGDKRFSALYAKLSNGRTIENIYQTDIKGYKTQQEGKGKPPLKGQSREELYQQYKDLWKQYFNENPELINNFKGYIKEKGITHLTDMFATTEISQARAISELLNETNKSQDKFINTKQTTQDLVNYDNSIRGIVDNKHIELDNKLNVVLDKLGLDKSHNIVDNKGINITDKDLLRMEETITSKLEGSNISEFKNPKIMNITSSFNTFLDKQQGGVDLKQYKSTSKAGELIVNKFINEVLQGRNKIPKDRLEGVKQQWNDWLKKEFGLRHKEGTYDSAMRSYDEHNTPYGLDSIIKRDADEKGLRLSGNEIIISGDYLFNDLPHVYTTLDDYKEIKFDKLLPSQEGTGLGWYIYTEINDIPFIYEWQSDVLPDIFGKSVSSTIKENPNNYKIDKDTEEFSINNNGLRDTYRKIDDKYTYRNASSQSTSFISKQEYKEAKSKITLPYEKEVLTSGEVRITDNNGTKYYNHDRKISSVEDLDIVSGDGYGYGFYTLEDGVLYFYDEDRVEGYTKHNQSHREGYVEISRTEYNRALDNFNKIDKNKLFKDINDRFEITKQQFEDKKKELEKSSVEDTIKEFTTYQEPFETPYYVSQDESGKWGVADKDTNRYAGIPIPNTDDIPSEIFIKTFDTYEEAQNYYADLNNKLIEKQYPKIANNKSSLPYLEQLYKKYWNIWLMHSFMYAKEKGHNEIYLPTGEAMHEIEGSKKTASMYLTSLDKNFDVRYNILRKQFNKNPETGKYQIVNQSGRFVGTEYNSLEDLVNNYKSPYWTALSKIKGIELKLEQPSWSTVPLIKANISNVDTSAYTLFSQENKRVLGKYSIVKNETYLNLEAIRNSLNPKETLYRASNHENLHQTLHKALTTDTNFSNKIKELVDYYKENGDKNTDYYKRVFQDDNSYKKNREYRSSQEFISEIFTNDDLQKEANDLEYIQPQLTFKILSDEAYDGRVIHSGYNRFEFYNSDEEEIGYIDVDMTIQVGTIDNTLGSSGSYIKEEYRNKGYGKYMYHTVGTELLKKGITLKSNEYKGISPSAERVWESLVKSGNAVKGKYEYSYTSNQSSIKIISFFKQFVQYVKEWLESKGIKLNDDSLLMETIRLTNEKFEDIINGKLNEIKQSNYQEVMTTDGKSTTVDSNIPQIENRQVNSKFEDNDNIESSKNPISARINLFTKSDGSRIWNNLFEGINEVRDLMAKYNGNQILARDEFISKYANVISDESISKIFKKKPLNNTRSILEQVFAELNGKNQYKVATIDLNNSNVRDVRINDKYYTYQGNTKSTIQQRSLMENIQERCRLYAIQHPDIFPNGFDFEFIPVVSYINKNMKEATSSIKKIDNDIAQKLYNEGYILLGNKNTQYLVSTNNAYFQAMSNLSVEEQTAKFFSDFTSIAEIGVSDFTKLLKRLPNILGTGKTGFISKSVEETCNTYPNVLRLKDGKEINITAVKLKLDGVLPQYQLDFLNRVGINPDNFKMCDGTVLTLDIAHDLEHQLHGVDLNDYGKVVKWKRSEMGDLVKNGDHRVDKNTTLGKWMKANGVTRIVIDSAQKIDMYNRPTVTLTDILDENNNIDINKTIDNSYKYDWNMLDDAFMFSKGEVKKQTKGLLGQFFTNAITFLNPKLRPLIERFMNNVTDRFVEKVNSWTFEERKNILKDFCERNPELVNQFETLQKVLELIENDTLSELDPRFTEQFNKNIYAPAILEALAFKSKGAIPTLSPDNPIFEYRSRCKEYMISRGMNSEQAETILGKAFDKSGFLNNGWMILSHDVIKAHNLSVESEAIGTCNPPNSPLDLKVKKILGVSNRETKVINEYGELKDVTLEKNFAVTSIRDEQTDSSKDFDFDTEVVAILEKELLDEIKNLDLPTLAEMEKAFNEQILSKQVVFNLRGFTGTKEELAQLTNETSDSFYMLAQIFGVKKNWNIQDDIWRTYNTLQGDLSEVGTAIGIEYGHKLLYQMMLEAGYTKDTLNDKNRGLTRAYIDKTKLKSNMMLFKHLTDLTIDTLSDQRILKLDITGDKVIAYLFNLKLDEAKEFRKEVYNPYFKPIRNLIKSNLNVFGYAEEYEGLNKVNDVLDEARKSINDSKNPFKDTTLFKVAKYFLDNYDRLPKMTATANEIRSRETIIRNNLQLPTQDRVPLLNRFLGLFYRMGNSIPVEYKPEGREQVEPDDGRGLAQLISDIWYPKYGKNNRGQIVVTRQGISSMIPSLSNINPVYDVFTKMLELNQYQLKEGRDRAWLKNFGLGYQDNRYHVFKRAENGKYTIQYLQKSDNPQNDATFNQNNPIFNSFNDYIAWHTNPRNTKGLGKTNFDKIFKSPILKDVFKLFEIRNGFILQECKNLMPKIIEKVVNSNEFMSADSSFQKQFLGNILGLYDNPQSKHKDKTGLNIHESLTTIKDGEHNFKYQNSSIASVLLGKIDNPIVKDFLKKYDDISKIAYDSIFSDRLGTQYLPMELNMTEEDLSTDDIIDKATKELKKTPSTMYFKPLMLYHNIVRKLGVKNILAKNLFDNIANYHFLGNNSNITRYSVEAYFGKTDGKLSGEMIDFIIKSNLSHNLTQLKADMKTVWNDVYLNMTVTKDRFNKENNIGNFAELEGTQILISDIAEGIVKGIEGIKFNADGTITFNNVTYNLYKLPSFRYKGMVNKQNELDAKEMNKLLDDIIKVNKVTPELYDKQIEGEEQMNESIIRRCLASAVCMRYAYDYYVPSILKMVKSNLEKQFQEALNITDTFKQETLVGEIKEAYIRVASMLDKIEGKSIELAKQGKFYIPHIYSNLELYKENLTDYFRKLGWEEAKVQREVAKRMDEIENGKGVFGEHIIADAFFNERILDLPNYNKSYNAIEAYFGSLGTFISNLSHHIQSLLNEQHITQQSTKMQYMREQLNARLEGADYRWDKLTNDEVKQLKSGDYIAFTTNGKNGVWKGKGEVLSNSNNKIKIKTGEKEILNPITKQKELTIITKTYDIFQISNVRKQDRAFTRNESVQNFFREVESILSKNNLGFMNAFFGTRNIIGGVIQDWVQYGRAKTTRYKGSIKIIETVGSIMDGIKDYKERRANMSEDEIKKDTIYEAYDIILDYSSAINGGVTEFMGKLMEIADLEGVQSTDLIKFLNAYRKEFDKDTADLNKLANKWRDSQAELGNNPEDSKGLITKMDYLYKKYRGYNIISMFPLIGKALDDNGKLGLILNPAKGEQWLRMRTASLVLLKMMDDLDYTNNSKNEEWRKWFNKTFATQVLAGVYETQVYYTPEFQANWDTIPLTKLFTLWGHYGMSLQSVFFKNLRDFRRQLNEYGSLTFKDFKRTETIGNMTIDYIERNAGKILVKQLFGHIIAETTTVIGYGLTAALFDSIGLGFIGDIVNGFYLATVKNTSAIPMLSVLMRGSIMIATILAHIEPPDNDSDDDFTTKLYKNSKKQLTKKFVGDYDTWKTNKERFLQSQKVPKQYWDNITDKNSYYQEIVMNFSYDGDFPGYGFNNIVDITTRLITSSIYPSEIQENILTMFGNKLAPIVPLGRQTLSFYNHNLVDKWNLPTWIGARNTAESKMYKSLQDWHRSPEYIKKQTKEEKQDLIKKIKESQGK